MDKKTLINLIKAAGVKKVAVGAVSLTLVTGGFNVLWKDYQQGNLFKPDMLVKNRELQGNQIMFPEKENMKPDEENNSQENDNKKLERDPESNDPYGQDKQNDSSYEMAMDQVTQNPENTGNIYADSSYPYAGNINSPSGNPDGQNLVLAPDAEEKVRVPGGYSEIPENNIHNNETPSSGGISDSSSTVVDGNSGGGGGASSGTNQDPVTPGGNADPAPNPDPAPTPTPDQPSGKPDSGDNTPVVDPDFPDASNPPKPAKDPTWGGTTSETIYNGTFPDEGYEEGSIDAESAVLKIMEALDSEVEFYQGAVITDWKILCRVYAAVDTDTGSYRIRNYSENFKIGDYPKVAMGDFTVTFYFRPNAQSPWQTVEKTFAVKYCRVAVMGAEDERGNRRTLDTVYLKKGESLSLLVELRKLYETQKSSWGIGTFDTLTEIVPGWITGEGEEILTDRYEPADPGRYELYPMERVPLPENFRACMDYDYTGGYIYKQLVSSYYGDPEVMEVPQGIQRVLCYATTVGKIIIPESVSELTDDFIVVTDSYEVAEGNLNYRSEDGVLYNKEKTTLMGIPTLREEIDIPETVDKVVLPEYGCNLKKISFTSENPPQIDLSRISGVQLMVPTEYYADYRIAWRTGLSGNSLVASDESIDYTYVNGAILSENKTVLNRISDENSGLWIVPAQVKRIKVHATDKCLDVDCLILPDSVEILEAESLSGEGLTEICFQGTIPPEIEGNPFGDLAAKDLTVYVPEGAKDAYMAKWSAILGEETVRDLIQEANFEYKETEDGMVYLNMNGSVTLVQAPAVFTSFEDLGLPEDAFVTEIGNNAFDHTKVPAIVELPETVESIGRNAFANCDGMEGVISYRTDPIYIGGDAFSGLRFMAFNTSYLDMETPFMTRDIKTYVRTGISIPMQSLLYIMGCGEKVVLGDTEDTENLLFGLDGEETYLLNTTSDFSGEIKGLEGHDITYILRYAFSGCEGPFTLPDEVAANLKMIQWNAFENSGLTGSIHFTNTLTQIGSAAFLNCRDLTEITFEDADTSALSIKESAFQGTGLTRIVLPKYLSEIGYGAFLDTSVDEIIFTGSKIPRINSVGPGNPYFFMGEEDDDGLIKLDGDAKGMEQKYIEAWKYKLQGYEDESKITEEGIYFTVQGDAMDEWIMVSGEYPMDFLTYEWYPEFLDYVNDLLPYYVENIKITGEARAYALFGLKAPDHPDRLEKPDINEYIDAWRERTEEEKSELPVLSVETKKDPLETLVPENPAVQDPSKLPTDPEAPMDPENPDTPGTPDGSEENPENPDKDKPSETPENPDKDNEESKDPSEAPDDPQSPSETPGDSDKDPQSPDENGNSGSTPDNGAESGKEEENAGSESAGVENASGESSGSESAEGGQEGSSENNTTENDLAENAQEDEGADHQNG